VPPGPDRRGRDRAGRGEERRLLAARLEARRLAQRPPGQLDDVLAIVGDFGERRVPRPADQREVADAEALLADGVGEAESPLGRSADEEGALRLVVEGGGGGDLIASTWKGPASRRRRAKRKLRPTSGRVRLTLV